MIAFLILLLAVTTLIGGGIVMHMYLYSQGVFAIRRTSRRARRSHPMVQRAFAQEKVVGSNLEAALGIDVEQMADPMSRLMRRGLLVLAGITSVLVLASILLLNVALR